MGPVRTCTSRYTTRRDSSGWPYEYSPIRRRHRRKAATSVNGIARNLDHPENTASETESSEISSPRHMIPVSPQSSGTPDRSPSVFLDAPISPPSPRTPPPLLAPPLPISTPSTRTLDPSHCPSNIDPLLAPPLLISTPSTRTLDPLYPTRNSDPLLAPPIPISEGQNPGLT